MQLIQIPKNITRYGVGLYKKRSLLSVQRNIQLLPPTPKRVQNKGPHLNFFIKKPKFISFFTKIKYRICRCISRPFSIKNRPRLIQRVMKFNFVFIASNVMVITTLHKKL